MYTYICVYEWETMAFKHLWTRFKVFPFEKNQPRPDRVVQEPLEWRLCSSPLAASLRYPPKMSPYPKTVYHAGCRDETTDDWDWWLDVWTVPSGDDSMGGLLWPIDETWWNHWDCWGWMGDWITFDDRIPMKKCCFDQAAGARRLWHVGHAFGAKSMASPRHDFFWDHPTNPWRAARMAPTGCKRGELTTICCGQNDLEIESDK